MKREFIIDLSNQNELRTFNVLVNERLKNDVTAYTTDGKYILNAKSLLALLSICREPFKVVLSGDRTPDLINFNEICKQYEV